MTIPVTGTTFNGAGFSNLNPESFEQGPNVTVLIRDARGAATDISPHNSDGSVRYSPFAQDNKWRGDLLARKKVNGYWITNPNANEGFLSTGNFKDGNGPGKKPGVKTNMFRILANNWSYHTTVTEESEPISFLPVDTGLPWLNHLRYNLRLSDNNGNIIVPDPGATNFGASRLLTAQNPGRQIFIVRQFYPPSGLPILKVDGYALCRWSDVGNSKVGDKQDGEGAELTYEPEPDGIMMAMAFNADGELEYQPVLMHTWYGGAGWTALGGVPTLSSTAPVATALIAAGEATLVFAEPTGPGDPWTYTVQQSTDGGSTWGPAIDPDDVAASSGTVTLSLSGLTSGASKLRATVAGTNGATATTPNSNSITVAS